MKGKRNSRKSKDGIQKPYTILRDIVWINSEEEVIQEIVIDLDLNSREAYLAHIALPYDIHRLGFSFTWDYSKFMTLNNGKLMTDRYRSDWLKKFKTTSLFLKVVKTSNPLGNSSRRYFSTVDSRKQMQCDLLSIIDKGIRRWYSTLTKGQVGADAIIVNKSAINQEYHVDMKGDVINFSNDPTLVSDVSDKKIESVTVRSGVLTYEELFNKKSFSGFMGIDSGHWMGIADGWNNQTHQLIGNRKMEIKPFTMFFCSGDYLHYGYKFVSCNQFNIVNVKPTNEKKDKDEVEELKEKWHLRLFYRFQPDKYPSNIFSDGQFWFRPGERVSKTKQAHTN